MRFFLYVVERTLTLFHVIPPPLAGWEVRVVDFAGTQGLWRDPVTGVFGAPVEWSLCERRDGRLVNVEATCVQTGRPISGEIVPVLDVAGNPVSVDGTRWGVRCARCGRPLHWRAAGMKGQLDVPTCSPCRPWVRHAERSA